jgi:hypothetical protein
MAMTNIKATIVMTLSKRVRSTIGVMELLAWRETPGWGFLNTLLQWRSHPV